MLLLRGNDRKTQIYHLPIKKGKQKGCKMNGLVRDVAPKSVDIKSCGRLLLEAAEENGDDGKALNILF